MKGKVRDMNKIHARIQTDKAFDVLFNPQDHDLIYDAMMEVTDNDHEISCDAASWCEIATVGELYDFREGTITIVEI